MRETERREQAAIKYAEALKAQVEEQAKKATTADTQYVSEFEGRIKATQDTLQSKLREAIDRGDTEAQVQAQTELANLASENVKLSYIKKLKKQKRKRIRLLELLLRQPSHLQNQHLIPKHRHGLLKIHGLVQTNL